MIRTRSAVTLWAVRANPRSGELTMALKRKAYLSLIGLAIATSALIFVPAGTVRYWQGWAFLIVFFGAAIAMTADLIANDPALLERRMKGGPTAEKEPAQRVIMAVVSVCYVALLVVPALDRRFGWSPTSTLIAIAGDVLVGLGFFAIFFVYRENSFAATTIGVVANQKVVSTGPYAIVRHPMYAGGLVHLVGTPLALGSWWGLAPVAIMFPFFIWRLLDEERFLSANLRGYREYMNKVGWRLAPGIF
jgi:protein-S-isoprenylcysteine O-methyltransferase Ste14